MSTWEDEMDEEAVKEVEKKKKEEKKNNASEKSKATEKGASKADPKGKGKEDNSKDKKSEDPKKSLDDNTYELGVEKDFIELARRVSSDINGANKSRAFTLSYLQTIVELLNPSLTSSQMNELVKVIGIIYNNKLKEERGKQKKSKKPTVNIGKGVQRGMKKGVYEDNPGRIEDDDDEDFDDYDD